MAKKVKRFELRLKRKGYRYFVTHSPASASEMLPMKPIGDIRPYRL
jgi:hypothetical protein